jgi:hypothetical protein
LTKQVQAVRVVTAFIDRIEAVNPMHYAITAP